MGTTITNWFSVSESVVNRESWIVSHSADVEVIKMVRCKEIEGGRVRIDIINTTRCIAKIIGGNINMLRGRIKKRKRERERSRYEGMRRRGIEGKREMEKLESSWGQLDIA